MLQTPSLALLGRLITRASSPSATGSGMRGQLAYIGSRFVAEVLLGRL